MLKVWMSSMIVFNGWRVCFVHGVEVGTSTRREENLYHFTIFLKCNTPEP